MKRYTWIATIIGLALCGQPKPASAVDGNQVTEILQPFVQAHCVRCHGPDTQNAERRFDSLPPAIASDNVLVDYQDILDQLNLGQMPPEDEPQPSDAQRRLVVELLTSEIAQYHAATSGHERTGVLRRMNAREYKNTVSDLFQLNLTMFDPTLRFPKDQTLEHLDNVGSVLATSGFLLQRYLDAADAVVEKILAERSRPQTQTWTFSDNLHQQSEIDQVHRRTSRFEYLTLYDVRGADKHEGAYAPIHAFSEGVPHDGFYELRFEAEAVNRLHPYEDTFLGIDQSEALRLGIVAGNQAAGPLHKPQPIEPMLAQLDLADEKQWYTQRVWLDKGFTPRFTFENGLMDARSLWSRLIRRYPEDFAVGLKGIVDIRRAAITDGKLPQIRIYEIQIRGPLVEAWPSTQQQALLGNDANEILVSEQFSSPNALRAQLEQVARRAFRRPPTNDEIHRLTDLVATRQQAGRSELQAFGDAVKAILSSPHFIFLKPESQNSDYQLATKLSYFLWSSTPDAHLLQLAESAELSNPETFDAQVARMLDHDSAQNFVQDFVGSWLNLRSLGATPPDRDRFREFYHYDLGEAMHQETELYFMHLLRENLSADAFLDSDFTFVNKRLAQHYGIAFTGPNVFQKVALSDRRRGGLLGQASVLTVSANGIDTSPVVRGVWVLENLLGTPPAPPPPDVEPLDPDTRGATTIRDQLRKHREVASCNDCHRKIDPMGFALENFNPIGGWRDAYGRNLPIDASATLPGGREYQDIVGFKSHLLDEKPLFYRALVRKLLAYAHGRPMGPRDGPLVTAITDRMHEPEFGMRDVVQAVARSLK